jgi:MFS family permease
MASLLASGFGPIFAYALSLISVGDGMYASGWRWIFIIEGIVTIAAGLIGPLFLVEFPERVTWLNDREKHIAIRRVRVEKDKTEVVHATAMQSLKMMKDWKLLV